jgi:iron complex transport system ATP-binding protein
VTSALPAVASPAPLASGALALRARGVAVRHGRAEVVTGLDLDVPAGALTALVGPNGSGKSTILRALAGIHAPAAGTIEVGGEALAGLRPRQRARTVAYLPQDPPIPTGLSVREVVELGRHPHRGLFEADRHDRAIVDRALREADAAPLADRRVEQLSGGERQRVWLATALAQDAPVVLLDEPTTFLDIRHQLELLALLRAQVAEHGRTVVAVLHELTLATAHADHLVVMDAGRIVAQGEPVEVATSPALARAFGVAVTVGPHPVDGSPVCFFAPKVPAAPEAPSGSPAPSAPR